MQLFIRKLIDTEKETKLKDKERSKKQQKLKKETVETMVLDPDMREQQ